MTDTKTISKSSWSIKKESLWEIILLNDDCTPFEGVILVLLESGLASNPSHAWEFAKTANSNGKCSLLIAPFIRANELYNTALAVSQDFGLYNLGFDLKEVKI